MTGYFPDAYWFDYYTGQLVSSKAQSLSIQAPLEFIPYVWVGVCGVIMF